MKLVCQVLDVLRTLFSWSYKMAFFLNTLLLIYLLFVVGHFKHSSIAYHKLATIQENLQLPKHTLKQDVSKQKMALAAYAAENDIQQLTANQLEITRKMMLVLEPVEEITQVISKETATLSMVIPFVRILLRSWEKEEDDRGIQTMKHQMTQSLKSRFAGIEDNKLLCLATLLDPRFKDKFCQQHYKSQCKRHAGRRIRS